MSWTDSARSITSMRLANGEAPIIPMPIHSCNGQFESPRLMVLRRWTEWNDADNSTDMDNRYANFLSTVRYNGTAIAGARAPRVVVVGHSVRNSHGLACHAALLTPAARGGSISH